VAATSDGDPGTRPEVGTDDTRDPVLRVVAGRPTADELAAVTALLTALEAGRGAREAAELAAPTVSAWTRSARAPRATPVAGPGRWRGFSG